MGLQIGRSEKYSVIQRVICVCILSYELFPGVKEYLNNFQFYNAKNGLLFAEMPEEIYTLELSKAPALYDGSAVWAWLQFLRSKEKEEFEMVAARNPEIRQAVDTLYELSADEKVRAEYEMRQKAWRDRISQFDDYYQEGMEKGIEKGMKKRDIDIARNALAKGLPIDMIRDITGLDMTVIQNIQAQLN